MTLEIFSQNFRGISDLSFSLDGTTFLVGDNSSGKSSALYLAAAIIRSSLSSSIHLEPGFSVGRYDFFSPYFDYAPVTLGYRAETEGGLVYKVVTLRLNKETHHPDVQRSSIVSSQFRFSIKKHGAKFLAKLDASPMDVTAFDPIAYHNGKSGYRRIQRTIRRGDINAPVAIFPVLEELSGSGNLDESVLDVVLVDLPNYRHVGPLRALPERMYDFERAFKARGAHFATMWQDIGWGSKNGAHLKDIVARFGKESGLFDEIDVHPVSKSIYDSPLFVSIKKNGKSFYINQVGIGVSQIIPVIVESLYALRLGKGPIVLLQQPELHLHPVAQAALGDLIFDLSQEGLNFVIETHSNFLIDRFRARVNERHESDDQRPIRILYFSGGDRGNLVRKIEVDRQGHLIDPPESYFAFFLSEFERTAF